MSSNGYRFKRDVALARAQVLVELLRPTCTQIEIAGSLRRGKETVGDIEIVAQSRYEERVIPGQLDLFGGGTAASVERISLLDKKLEELVAASELLKDRPHTAQKGCWGEKMKTLWAKILIDGLIFYIQLDLFIVTPPAQWGPIFTIRTGPEEFAGRSGLMAYINGQTKYQQIDGRLIVRATGEEVQTPTEHNYFEVLGLPYIEPAERTAAKLWQIVKTKKPVASGHGIQIEPELLQVPSEFDNLNMHDFERLSREAISTSLSDDGQRANALLRRVEVKQLSGHGIQIEPPSPRKIVYTDEEIRRFIRERLEVAAGIN